jgi:hypothetical protein
VVVIDDQVECSIDDPAFLFETNEGFQEVVSKKAMKSKQKAAMEAEIKKQLEQKKKEKDGVKKAKVGITAVSKLPGLVCIMYSVFRWHTYISDVH